MIIICVYDDNAVFNNNYGRLQGSVLLFRISMGTRKNFFEIYGHFGRRLQEGSPALVEEKNGEVVRQ